MEVVIIALSNALKGQKLIGGCVISLDNGSRGRAESPKAPSPGHRPG